MKLSYLFLPLALCLAGCSTCPQPRHAASLTGNEQSACARKTADQSGGQYRLSDLASEAVFDRSGHEVARLDDLTMAPNGRVVSVTLSPTAGGGAKVTIPYEKLRIKRERNGTVSLETDVVFKVPGEGEAASPPQRRFWWKKAA